jgi:hypothetical protein
MLDSCLKRAEDLSSSLELQSVTNQKPLNQAEILDSYIKQLVPVPSYLLVTPIAQASPTTILIQVPFLNNGKLRT